MNIMPKAKPPSTRCQYQGMENIGLVAEPIRLNSVAVSTMPIMTPATIRRGHATKQDDRPANQNHQRGDLPNGARDVAHKRIKP